MIIIYTRVVLIIYKIGMEASGLSDQKTQKKNFQFNKFPFSPFFLSYRSPHSRTPSPALLDAATNVVEFIKDERYHRGRRGFVHSRYPKGGTSSASTSPDLDRYPKEKNRSGHLSTEYNTKTTTRRPPRRWRKGVNYETTYTNQSSADSYEYDNNVLSGRSRTPSPRFGNGLHFNFYLKFKIQISFGLFV